MLSREVRRMGESQWWGGGRGRSIGSTHAALICACFTVRLVAKSADGGDVEGGQEQLLGGCSRPYPINKPIIWLLLPLNKPLISPLQVPLLSTNQHKVNLREFNFQFYNVNNAKTWRKISTRVCGPVINREGLEAAVFNAWFEVLIGSKIGNGHEMGGLFWACERSCEYTIDDANCWQCAAWTSSLI